MSDYTIEEIEEILAKDSAWRNKYLIIDGEAIIRQLLKERDALQAKVDAGEKVIDELIGIMGESTGVAGYHFNNMAAEWDEFHGLNCALAAYPEQENRR